MSSDASSGVKPSELKARYSKEPLVKKIPTQQKSSSADDIPDDEKLRLIDQSGLMQKVETREAEIAAEQEETSTGEYIWQAIFLSIPFAFLMGTFDISVKVQYSEPWSYYGMFLKCAKSAPVLAPFIYLTNRYKDKKSTQVLMAIGSSFAGSLLMYTLKRSPSLGQMMRAPGLATIWIYFIVQLDLIPATLTLFVVGAYWYFGLRS